MALVPVFEFAGTQVERALVATKISMLIQCLHICFCRAESCVHTGPSSWWRSCSRLLGEQLSSCKIHLHTSNRPNRFRACFSVRDKSTFCPASTPAYAFRNTRILNLTSCTPSVVGIMDLSTHQFIDQLLVLQLHHRDHPFLHPV